MLELCAKQVLTYHMGQTSQLRITHTSTCTNLTVSTKWEALEAGGWTESCWAPSLGNGALLAHDRLTVNTLIVAGIKVSDLFLAVIPCAD